MPIMSLMSAHDPPSIILCRRARLRRRDPICSCGDGFLFKAFLSIASIVIIFIVLLLLLFKIRITKAFDDSPDSKLLFPFMSNIVLGGRYLSPMEINAPVKKLVRSAVKQLVIALLSCFSLDCTCTYAIEVSFIKSLCFVSVVNDLHPCPCSLRLIV